ncbi:hypothetical protein YC2023_117355 [Brassica napus]
METIPVSAESFKVGLIGAGKMAEIIDREESFIEFWISSLCSNISGQILASLVMNPPKPGDELCEWPEHQEACEGWFMLEHQNVLNCLFLYLFSATMPEEKIVDTKKSHNS